MMNVTGYSEHAMGWLVMRKEIQVKVAVVDDVIMVKVKVAHTSNFRMEKKKIGKNHFWFRWCLNLLFFLVVYYCWYLPVENVVCVVTLVSHDATNSTQCRVTQQAKGSHRPQRHPYPVDIL